MAAEFNVRNPLDIYIKMSKTIAAGTIELQRKPTLVGEHKVLSDPTAPGVSGCWVVMLSVEQLSRMRQDFPIEVTPSWVDNPYSVRNAGLVMKVSDFFYETATEIDFDYREMRARQLLHMLKQEIVSEASINLETAQKILDCLDKIVFRWHEDDIAKLKTLTKTRIHAKATVAGNDHNIIIYVEWLG